MTSETPWLSERQQSVWRGWLALNAALPAALHRDLQATSGLSLQDFDVLVRLTDTPERRLRVSELARALLWERSRLSHHLRRMEARGLVAREECVEDARGAFVVLTDAGSTALREAAPSHVRTVRSLVFDDLTADELEVLGTVLARVRHRIAAAGDDVVATATADSAVGSEG